MASLADARRAKDELADLLRDQPAVTGIGVTRSDDGFLVKVNLIAAPEGEYWLPDEVNGVHVRWEVVGPVYKQSVKVTRWPHRRRQPKP